MTARNTVKYENITELQDFADVIADFIFFFELQVKMLECIV